MSKYHLVEGVFAEYACMLNMPPVYIFMYHNMFCGTGKGEGLDDLDAAHIASLANFATSPSGEANAV
jgi:hypothetical protein